MTEHNPGLPVPVERGFLHYGKVIHYAVKMSNGEMWRSDVPTKRFWDHPDHPRTHKSRQPAHRRWCKVLSRTVQAGFIAASWEPVMISTPFDPPGFHVELCLPYAPPR